MPGRAKSGRFMKKKEVERRKNTVELNKLDRKKRKAASEPVVEVGRRIIDLDVLANDMWCKICEQPLHFKYMEKEVRRGLASTFPFRCSACLEVTQVCSSKVAKSDDLSGYPVYSVNCKAALGCLDSGCGHEQFSHLLTTMNIPPVSHHTLKLAEEKNGKAVENTAKASCQAALLDKKALTLQKNDRNVA